MIDSVILNIVLLLFLPFASVRLASAIFYERAIPFLSTERIVAVSIKVKNKTIKAMLKKLADWCDCYWCTSYISSIIMLLLFIIPIARYTIVVFGLSGITIIIDKIMNRT